MYGILPSSHTFTWSKNKSWVKWKEVLGLPGLIQTWLCANIWEIMWVWPCVTESHHDDEFIASNIAVNIIIQWYTSCTECPLVRKVNQHLIACLAMAFWLESNCRLLRFGGGGGGGGGGFNKDGHCSHGIYYVLGWCFYDPKLEMGLPLHFAGPQTKWTTE